MASDMSGFAGPGGAEAWMAASGGDRAAYNREMKAWQNAQAPAAAPPPTAAPAPAAATGAPNQQSLDQQAQWAHDNIDSTIDVGTWKAQGPMDSSCPQDNPYRSSRKGGDNACVEKPDNCPEGKTLHGDTCISNEAANQMFGGGYGGVPEGAYKQGGQAAQPRPAGQPALTPQQELQQKLKSMYQNREGQFAGQANTGQELAGGGVFWGQQAAGATPPPPPANPSVAAISSGSGATPLSQGVTPAPQIQATSSFANSVGNESAGHIQMPEITKSTAAPAQAQSMGVAAPTGQLALSNAVKKQYANPREQQQWWKAM